MAREYKIFYRWGVTDEDLFRQIDEVNGGWPANAGSLVVKHGFDDDNEGRGRGCYFSKSTWVGDEWNSSHLTADDYYWYKLSQNRKDKFAEEVRDKIRNRI